MCFGENFDIFCLFEPGGFCVKHTSLSRMETGMKKTQMRDATKKKVKASMCGLGESTTCVC